MAEAILQSGTMTATEVARQIGRGTHAIPLHAGRLHQRWRERDVYRRMTTHCAALSEAQGLSAPKAELHP